MGDSAILPSNGSSILDVGESNILMSTELLFISSSILGEDGSEWEGEDDKEDVSDEELDELDGGDGELSDRVSLDFLLLVTLFLTCLNSPVM